MNTDVQGMASSPTPVGRGAALRSRRLLPQWIALMAALSAVMVVASLVTPGSALAGANHVLSFAILVICVLCAVVPAVRGERITDVVVLLIAMATDGMIAFVGRLVEERQPGGDAMLMLLTWPTLIAAVYLRRPLVVVQVVAAAAAGVYIMQGLLVTHGVATLQLSLLTLSLAIVALVVTQLRESLVEALNLARHAARVDNLTGLVNRQGIMELMPALWASTTRHGERLEVLMVDIDHFKAVNDLHDHAAGDKVLAQVAGIIRASVRTEDLAGRLGGEEFLVVAAVARAMPAGRLAERLRRAVEEQTVPIPVTVSIGSTTLVPTRGADVLQTLEQQVHLADQAMYESKRAGRNCVTLR